ncbi:MAG: hypothetical protein LUQ57_05035, partial [Methylococcaceae bacterium]|nr:hypothetical protein [Methylococcaceae bacterium]
HALHILYRALRDAMPIFFLVAAGLMLIWAHTLYDFSPDRPRPNSIVYALDIPSHSAKWLSYDPEPDDWTRQFLGANPAVVHTGIFDQFESGLRLLEQQTSPVDLVAPDVHLVDRRRVRGKTYVKVRIKSNRDTSFMRIRFDGPGDMIAFYAGDRLIYQKNQSAQVASIDLHALPEQGTILTFVLPADISLQQLEIIETRPDLAEIWQSKYQPRPENSMPMRSSSTLPVDAVILRQLYFL